MKTANWAWPQSNPNGGADGSSLSKLFRGGPLNDAALLAREALQNSCDANHRFLLDHPGIPFKVVFRFVHLFGAEKAAAVEAMNLRGLSARRAEYPKDPLQPGSVLDSLDDPRVPLPLLYIEDFGTHGLFGSIHIGLKSHLFKAMYYIGASSKGADDGGSYGFGKSALERASRTHSVIAYSAFEPFEGDPVRTRLVGFTWWPNLQVDDLLFDGRASFSDHHAEGASAPVATPFEDSTADVVAAELGFTPRDPADLAQLGSSFLIIDPAIDPEALVEEIERWWWPALEEHRLDVQIVLPSGETRVPKPASNPFVAQFLRAFRIATRLDEPTDTNRERLASEDWRDRSGSGGKNLGALALVVPDSVVDDDGEELEATPLVALMRSPRMVIQYMTFPRRRVPLRGVFVAGDDINSLLRDTEPSSHDRWTANSSPDIPQRSTETARAVLEKIRGSVRKMANDFTPPPPKNNRALAHFSKLMNGFMGSKRGGGTGPKPRGEPIELQFPDGRPEPEVLTADDVRISTHFAVRAADDAEQETCLVRVSCNLFIYEDDSQSQSKWPVVIAPTSPASGFTPEEDGSWIGLISKETRVQFEVVSDPYPNLWTISLQPSVTRISAWGEV